MSVAENELTMRPISGLVELDLFCRLPYVLNEELSGDLETGRRRPEWMWVALQGDRPLARVAWWGNGEEGIPQVLDIVDADDSGTGLDRVDIMTTLLSTATAAVIPAGARPPEYSRFVPPDWRDHSGIATGVADRMAAVERTGGRPLVERLRFEWHPGTPIPESTKDLTFRPPLDNEEIIALMTLALVGTLDAHSQHDMVQMSPREAAVRHFDDELAAYRSPRAWWRVATRAGGQPVGFVIPARNQYNAIIAYLAVLPNHRGQGYVDQILAEGTNILARQNVPRIRASTDLANVPMAAAFERAGWDNFERTINMTW